MNVIFVRGEPICIVANYTQFVVVLRSSFEFYYYAVLVFYYYLFYLSVIFI